MQYKYKFKLKNTNDLDANDKYIYSYVNKGTTTLHLVIKKKEIEM